MWANSKRYVVKEEFLRLLRKHCSEDEAGDGERDGIVRFGKQGLVALVNSTRIKIYDTPGYENWNKSDLQQKFGEQLLRTDPICVIFCASPGSYASLQPLTWIVDMCRKTSTFIALVCTNMFAGANRKSVIDDFSRILNQFGQMTEHHDKINCWGNFALTAMVNSVAYTDEELGVHREPEGIDELILGILKSLHDEKFEAWCMAILNNRGFWTRQNHKMRNFGNKLKHIGESAVEIFGNFKDFISEELLEKFTSFIDR
ncbi:unnamed protein product [Rotaria sp. Silwood1]|nr:unnamed protein product [Rotaria sp. Silwood1]